MAPCSPKHLNPLTAGVKRKPPTIEAFKLPPAKHLKTPNGAPFSEKFGPKSPVFEKAALRKALAETSRASPETTAPVKEAGPLEDECTAGRDALAALRERHLLKRYASESNGTSPQHASALTALRNNPIRFVPATRLTFDDEKRLLRKSSLASNQSPLYSPGKLPEQTTVQPPVQHPEQTPEQHHVQPPEQRLQSPKQRPEQPLVHPPMLLAEQLAEQHSEHLRERPSEQPSERHPEQPPVQYPVKPPVKSWVQPNKQEANTTVPTTWPSSAPSRPQGLRNPGALCYRLGVFQSLLHLPMFYHWLQMHNCNSESCLACVLKHLAKAYWHQPARVHPCLKRVNEVIRGIGRRSVPRWHSISSFEQADAHEFMAWILEILQNRHNVPAKVMEGMFKIQHQARWKCQDCGHVHPGPAIDDLGLQLQIVTPRPNLHISQYIDQYYNDLVQDAKCEKCKSKRNRTRATSINAAPEVLIVQLRRFEMTRNGGRRKLASKVSFDEWLDLSKYAANPVLRKSKGIHYRLSSVVQHAGSLTSGHYVSIAESPGGVFMLNDDRVSTASKADMLDAKGGFTPYILTYMRCEHDRGESDEKQELKK